MVWLEGARGQVDMFLVADYLPSMPEALCWVPQYQRRRAELSRVEELAFYLLGANILSQ